MIIESEITILRTDDLWLELDDDDLECTGMTASHDQLRLYQSVDSTHPKKSAIALPPPSPHSAPPIGAGFRSDIDSTTFMPIPCTSHKMVPTRSNTTFTVLARQNNTIQDPASVLSRPTDLELKTHNSSGTEVNLYNNKLIMHFFSR